MNTGERLIGWFEILHHMGQWIVLAVIIYVGNMVIQNGAGVHQQAKLAQEEKVEGYERAKLFLSFNSRAFLPENISTRQKHTPFTISTNRRFAPLFGYLARRQDEIAFPFISSKNFSLKYYLYIYICIYNIFFSYLHISVSTLLSFSKYC